MQEESGAQDAKQFESSVEHVVADLWAEYTGTCELSPGDDFCRVGGSSLLLLEVLSELGWKYGVKLSSPRPGEHVTVRSLAQQIELRLRHGSDRVHQRILVRSVPQAVPAVPGRNVTGRPLINVSATRISGPVEIDVLKQAIAEIVRRHEVLRCHVDGLCMSVEDISSLQSSDRDSWLDQRMHVEQAAPMDHPGGPLLRASFVKCGAGEAVLILAVHSSICDAVSLVEVVPDELVILYEAFSRGEASPLRDPLIQFAEYSSWQRLRREALDDFPVASDPFATIRANSNLADPGVNGSLDLLFPQSFSQLLVKYAERQATPVWVVVLLAFAVFAGRLSRNSRIQIGLETDRRTSPASRSMVGPLSAVGMLVVDLEQGASFSESLAKLKSQSLEMRHQHLVSEQAHRPTIPITFAAHRIGAPHRSMDATEFSLLEVRTRSCDAELAAHCLESQAGIRLCIEYSSLFDGCGIGAELEHLQSMLLEIAS
jgi:hypothetical protein